MSSRAIGWRIIRKANPRSPVGFVILVVALIVVLQVNINRVLDTGKEWAKIAAHFVSLISEAVAARRERDAVPSAPAPAPPLVPTTMQAQAGHKKKSNRAIVESCKDLVTSSFRRMLVANPTALAGDTLPLRGRPAAEVLTEIEPGQRVAWSGHSVERQGTQWHCVSYRGRKGWVSAYYLSAL